MTDAARPQVKLKTVALPAEHGGWGFVLEPALLGLLAAPSWAGLALGLATFGLFLCRQPVKIAWKDRHRGKRYARTALAERFALLYGMVALAGGLIALIISGPEWLIPLLAALPLGAVQLIYDARSDSRALLPELAGPLALGMAASSIALAGNWSLIPALMLWMIITARALPSVLYVRARLKLEKDKPVNALPPVAASLLAVGILALLAMAGHVPWLSVLAGLILLARAAWGLSRYRRSVPAKVIGFSEIGYGLLTVLLSALGLAWGI